MKRLLRFLLSLVLLNTAWAARVRLQPPLNSGEREGLLRSWLRRWPYWFEGHRKLAVFSLSKKELSQAYGSALALQSLAVTGAGRRQAEWMLGRCMLVVGDGAGARAHLERALAGKSRNRFAIQEDLAAAYHLLGAREKSVEILSRIPPERRSPEAEAFLRSSQPR